MLNVSNHQAPYQDNQSVKSKTSKHSKQSSLNQGGSQSGHNQRELFLGGSNYGFAASTFRLKASSGIVASPDVKASTIAFDTERKKRSFKETRRRLQMKGSLLDDVKVDENGKHYLPQ